MYILKDSFGIHFLAGALGAVAPGNMKGYNPDFCRITFSFQVMGCHG